MKKYLLILFTIGLLVGCDKYDDGELWDNINNLEARLTALEKQCKEMNTNIEAMKVIVDVLQSGDYVTNVTVVSENGVEIGYKIDFHVNPSITIYHGKKGENGEDGQTPHVGENGNWWIGDADTRVKATGEAGQTGETPKIGSNGNWWIGSSDTGIKAEGKDGVTPIIGIKQAEDGFYYWTQKVGENESVWILDINGDKVKATGEDGQTGKTPYIGSNGNWWIGEEDTQVKATGNNGVDGTTPSIGSNGNWWIGSSDTGIKVKGEDGKDGITPRLKIEDDNWMLSVDNGVTWQNLGKAKGDNGDSFFKSVTNDADNLTLELGDGTVVKLPKKQVFSITLDKTQIPDVLPGTSYEINYIIEGEVNQQSNIETIAPNGWKVVVQRQNNRGGKIIVTTPSSVVDGKILVLVTDGNANTLIRTIVLLKGNLSISKTNYTVESVGETLVVQVKTSIDYGVNIAMDDQAWISCEINPLNKEQFSLVVEANPRETFRYATIDLVNEEGFVLEKIFITQKSATVNMFHVEIAGTLENLVSTEELNNYENVKITGQLNTFDYDYLKLARDLKGVDLTDLDMNTIPASAFSGSSLQTVLLPKNLVIIPSRAFYQSEITSIKIPETVTEIGEYAFYQCKQIRGDLVIPSNVESIGAYAFQFCHFDGKLTFLTSRLKEIKENTFDCCRFTGDLELPLNIEKIGEYAFRSCNNFTGLFLNGNLLFIKDYAFYGCSGFEGNLIIPDNVQTIGERAFYSCTGCKGSLVIGKNVVSLARQAFSQELSTYPNRYLAPLNFNKIYFKSIAPPDNLYFVFGESDKNSLEYVAVPMGSKDSYIKALSDWIKIIEEVEF